MNSSFFKSSIIILFLLVFLIIFSFSIISNSTDLPYSFQSNNMSSNFIYDFDYFSSEFYWPTPNFSTITSYFGYRKQPARGASTYHSGIDIAAPVRFKCSCFFFWYGNLYRFLWCWWFYCNNF